MVVFGTRPEAIKMGPLCNLLITHQQDFETLVCVTAQHRHMLDQVLQIFGIIPDFDLNLMKDNQDLFDVTSSVLTGMKSVLSEFKPDVLLVHGDTTTAFAAALAGFYSGVTVGHVEAGLRTNNIYAPYPEEFNRRAVSVLARWHFAPTATSLDNLKGEGIPESQIIVTGNTVIDALFWVLQRIESDTARLTQVTLTLDGLLPFSWKDRRFVLVTGHRRENFGCGFLQICEALKELAYRYPNVHYVYPVHLNPNVQVPVRSILAGIENVHLIEPLGYEAFAYLLKHSFIVMTDSGGIQEEAPSLGKPVLVLRDLTERPEAVQSGTVRLVGNQKENIIMHVAELLENRAIYESMALAINPYGDGSACKKIVEVLRT